MAGWDADVDISQGANGRIDRLVVRDASLSKVLALLAQTYHLNIVASNDIDAVISITLRDVALEEALTAILSVANYTWVNRDGIILITSLTDTGQLAPDVQGRADCRSSTSTSPRRRRFPRRSPASSRRSARCRSSRAIRPTTAAPAK